MLAKQVKYFDAIRTVIPAISECLKDVDSNVRSNATFTLVGLAEQDGFTDAIRTVVPPIAACLKDVNQSVASNAVSALEKLAKRADFYDVVRAVVPPLTEALNEHEYYIGLLLFSRTISYQTAGFDV
ncbi:hypothetical protein M408DRAFT_179642 [Serendipita vermifera MAFF 305830]|uniref:Condensin complex subunit 1 C-terminal domain-containing protein n=1 Tax=Serendipita vermifera MAFF 305830 TaxID=933852 RepID=A0A0C2WK41_SERVB|nr:hypothetical protein M408DRAFT_179642 [Serendipita vermifera MAFF 305830]